MLKCIKAKQPLQSNRAYQDYIAGYEAQINHYAREYPASVFFLQGLSDARIDAAMYTLDANPYIKEV